MENDHTPGPWSACPPEMPDNENWSVQADGGMTFIVCGGDNPTNAANADLVAAAPELLEQCKYLLENGEAAGWSEFMLSGARVAIAKAERKH